MKPILINLRANEYIQGLHYYPSVVTLDRCTASSNTPNIHPVEYVFQTKQRMYI